MPWNFRAPGGALLCRQPSEDDRAYAREARGRLDITPRTNIEALVSQSTRQRHSLGAL